jgi:hypothetical protein
MPRPDRECVKPRCACYQGNSLEKSGSGMWSFISQHFFVAVSWVTFFFFEEEQDGMLNIRLSCRCQCESYDVGNIITRLQWWCMSAVLMMFLLESITMELLTVAQKSTTRNKVLGATFRGVRFLPCKRKATSYRRSDQ